MSSPAEASIRVGAGDGAESTPAAAAAADHAYRPHLDGVRALAVVAVILFHLGFGWIPGGFIGVDVFFVLSGYLITGILAGEIDTRGTVRLGRFYSRRVRRLLPASVLVLVVVAIVGYSVFDPIQRDSLGWDTVFAALYSANWRFAFAGGDYFAPGDIPSPLVHFWSLAVEEQFYFVWPALLLALHKVARRVRSTDALPVVAGLLGVLLSISLVLSIRWSADGVTYYATYTRAYQLLAGALTALLLHRRDTRFPDRSGGRAAASALTVVSFAVLAFLACRIASAAGYPGWNGLWVTVASLGLIVGLDRAPTGAPFTRLVGAGPLAAIGRLSYSLYIWHWPVIVLLPLLIDGSGRLAQVAAMVALAGVSYLVVERPVRFRLRPSAAPLRVVAVGLSLSVLVAFGGHRFLAPRGDIARRAVAAVKDMARPEPCPYFTDEWPSPSQSEPCLLRDGSGPTIAFVGDSHAQQWQPAIEALAERLDARVVRATRGGCPANDVTPFLRTETNQIEVESACTQWRRHVYPEIVERYDPDVVFVATRSQVRGLRVDGTNLYPRTQTAAHLKAWTNGWDATFDMLSSGGATVVVSEILPTLPERVPACLIEHGDDGSCDFPVAGDHEVEPFNATIASFDGTRDGRVRVVDLTEIACPGGECRAIDAQGTIIHRDDNHLSATFVREHAAEFATVLERAGVDLSD